MTKFFAKNGQKMKKINFTFLVFHFSTINEKLKKNEKREFLVFVQPIILTYLCMQYLRICQQGGPFPIQPTTMHFFLISSLEQPMETPLSRKKNMVGTTKYQYFTSSKKVILLFLCMVHCAFLPWLKINIFMMYLHSRLKLKKKSAIQASCIVTQVSLIYFRTLLK